MCPPPTSPPPSATAPPAPAPSPNRAAILRRLVDAHCHPTDRHDYVFDQQKPAFDSLELSQICAMSSNLDNQDLVKQISLAYPDTVIPSYGIHPWFTHPLSFDTPVKSKDDHYTALLASPTAADFDLPALIASLPAPVPIATFLAALRANLLAQPNALVGEVGLDKAFRIPLPPTEPDAATLPSGDAGTRPTSPLRTSPFATPLAHQAAVLRAQVLVAVELRRNVSFHSVRAPEDTVRFLQAVRAEIGDEFERIHLCLHSFGGSAETAKRIQKAHPNVYFSFSTAISGRSPKFYDLLRAVEPHRLLLESDYPAVGRMDGQVWDAFEAVMEARGWDAERTVGLLEANWRAFREEGVVPERKEPRTRGGKKHRKKKAEGGGGGGAEGGVGK